MDVADSFAFDEFICQPPRPGHKKADRAKKFRIPIQEFVENVEKDMPKRPAIIDRCLSALRTIVAGQLRAAVFAMAQWWQLSIFSSPKPPATGFSFDGRNGGVAQND